MSVLLLQKHIRNHTALCLQMEDMMMLCSMHNVLSTMTCIHAVAQPLPEGPCCCLAPSLCVPGPTHASPCMTGSSQACCVDAQPACEPLPALPTSGHCLAVSLCVPDHLPQATFLEVPDNRISRLHCAIRLQASGCLCALLCISLPALCRAPAGMSLPAMLSSSSSASHFPQTGARALPPAQSALL